MQKSTLQQSKQEAKVSNNQTAPVLLQQAQWKYWSEQFLKIPTIWIALKIALQVRTEAAFNGDCKCQPYDEYHELNYHFRECTLRKKKLNVCTEQLQRSPLLHLSRHGDTVHKSNIKPPRLESMYWMSLRIRFSETQIFINLVVAYKCVKILSNNTEDFLPFEFINCYLIFKLNTI